MNRCEYIAPDGRQCVNRCNVRRYNWIGTGAALLKCWGPHIYS